MNIAGRREVLHIYNLSDGDRAILTGQGFEYLEDDICGNEIWEREDNFYVDDKTKREAE